MNRTLGIIFIVVNALVGVGFFIVMFGGLGVTCGMMGPEECGYAYKILWLLLSILISVLLLLIILFVLGSSRKIFPITFWLVGVTNLIMILATFVPIAGKFSYLFLLGWTHYQ